MAKGGRDVTTSLTPEERTLRARLGAYAMLANNDVMVTSAPGRAAADARFEDQVDPQRLLPEEERRRRAEMARKAHMSKMGLASARARRARKEGR